MTHLTRIMFAAGIATLLASAPTFAQDAAPETNDASSEATDDAPNTGADNLSLGQEVADENAVGQTYSKATHGDWDVRCVRTEDGNDPCQLYQLLKDGENSVAEISLFGLPDGQQAIAGATVVAPLETLLTQQMTLTIDGGQSRRYPFTWCAPSGCYARIGFTAADIALFKRGANASLTIVYVGAPEKKINLNVSLTGFTAGYDAILLEK